MIEITLNPIAYQIDEIEEKVPGVAAPVTRSVWAMKNLPDGLVFDPQTHTLSGRPTATGTFTAYAMVETNWGRATKTVSITIN